MYFVLPSEDNDDDDDVTIAADIIPHGINQTGRTNVDEQLIHFGVNFESCRSAQWHWIFGRSSSS